MKEITTLTDFLMWLSGSGAVIFLSWILEKMPWFQSEKIGSDGRFWIQLIGTVAIALAATAIQIYVPEDVFAQLAPFFTATVASVSFFIVNQLAHKVDPTRS